MDPATHASERINTALVPNRSGHRHTWPPHDGRWRIGSVNRAAPNTQVRFYVDAHAGDRESRLFVEFELIFDGSLEDVRAVASLVSAYSTIAARGGSIMLIPVAALEAMACGIMAFCSSLMLVCAGIVRNT